MILNKYIRITRILFILSSISLIPGQTQKELKQFMETYNKVKIGKEAGEVIKEGVEGEKDPEERPVRLLVKPADIDKYYREKMDVIRVWHAVIVSVINNNHFFYNLFLKLLF